MASTKIISEDTVRPKYYEVYGREIAIGNRAWLLAFLSIFIAVVALGFAIFVRLQPPTLIRIGPNGETTVLGRETKGGAPSAVIAGTDEFLNEAFVKLFLGGYLNYTPANVDERWRASLNMMTRNLREYALKSMTDEDTRDKIDNDQIQSVFHLREIDRVPGESLTFLVHGVKDVHRVTKSTETTDHFVNEYRVRLVADRRTDVNPDGLWVAEYSERPIDNERRDRILAMPDSEQPK